MAQAHGIEAIKWFIRMIGETDTFDQAILKSTEVVSAGLDKTVFRVKVLPEQCNSLGSMHGGALATAIDLLTSCAIMAMPREGAWESGAGVSRTLSVTYLRPAACDSYVLFTCKVVSLGKRSACITCDVTSETTGKVLAIGTHDKVGVVPMSNL
ncbi:HotDog domain-containing protein [Protomyces lactucae-debilis]|uniref:HotDog domain-containing protein n=1 Tax=Protomyces lactucae-debilis TaxID=2754530 RepID=A0A1Y2EYI3_PROLT|nr:HotDog domain-containing protein [Protomyces lactucae-debilis]ORY76304.1 HotDog domain-containing protein [Protomyces lactucae-debilis]